MGSLVDNPFAALTIVVAPAILTNASSVLALGTSNRIARVVDRTRFIAGELERLGAEHQARRTVYAGQLQELQVRAQLLLGALRWFYTALGSFAASALVAVFGSILATQTGPGVATAFAVIGLIVGTLAVGGLVTGCTLMVRETRLAVRHLAEEAALAGR